MLDHGLALAMAGADFIEERGQRQAAQPRLFLERFAAGDRPTGIDQVSALRRLGFCERHSRD